MLGWSSRVSYLSWLVGASTGSIGLAGVSRAFLLDVAHLVQRGSSTEPSTADAWTARFMTTLVWMLCLVVTLGLAAALAGRLPGAVGRGAQRAATFLLPRTLARIAAGACGLAVAVSPLAAGAATPSPTPVAAATTTAVSAGSGALPPVAVPEWPTDPGPAPSPVPTPPTSTPAPARPSLLPTTGPTPSPPAPSTSTAPVTAGSGDPNPAVSSTDNVVTVRGGDSLWLISARRLGAGATPRQITDEWRALYRENSDAIGPDPDLIRPGEVVHLPAESAITPSARPSG